MDYETLKAEIELGLTQREIARAHNVAQVTIRYWLRKLNLRTHYAKKPGIVRPQPEGYPVNPTAEDFAVAIVTAARLVGEDPIAIAERTRSSKARHYALHALIYWFPHADPNMLADRCGATGSHFYRNSCRLTADPNGLSSYTTLWWDTRIYVQVRTAIDAARVPRLKAELGSDRKPDVRTVRKARIALAEPAGETLPAPAMPTTPRKRTRVRSRPARNAGNLGKLRPEAIKAVLDDPIFDRGKWDLPKPFRPHAEKTKAELYEELRRAVENTAKMQSKE